MAQKQTKQPGTKRARAAKATSSDAVAAASGSVDRDIVIDAMLKLAAETGWHDVTLREIARASGVSLADLRAIYSSRTAILADLMARTDEAVLTRAESEVTGSDPHDRLFDVVMMRLEALAPYKTALRAIFRDASAAPEDLHLLLRAQAASQRWMLVAADLEPRGLRGKLRTAGLGLVYARILRTWIHEDEPDLPRTMAELDRRLRRGALCLDRMDGPIELCASAARMACDLGRQARAQRADRRARRAQGGPVAESDPAAA